MIEMMKIDMGGSGAVLGAAKTLALLKPEGIEVHFVIAACENMVAGGGMRPGDILVASNGKTVEINNTDAGALPLCTRGVPGVEGELSRCARTVHSVCRLP